MDADLEDVLSDEEQLEPVAQVLPAKVSHGTVTYHGYLQLSAVAPCRPSWWMMRRMWRQSCLETMMKSSPSPPSLSPHQQQPQHHRTTPLPASRSGRGRYSS
jgi:hypothetical protein